MSPSYWLFVLIFGFISCAKDSDPPGALNGTYSGKYIQSGDLQDTAVVRIVFIGSNFSGESTGGSRGICNGSYNVFSDSINFTNLCSTADSELILAGKFKMIETGDSLYFTRSFTNDIIAYDEIFSLKKQ